MKTFFELFKSYLQDTKSLQQYFELPILSCKINRQNRLMKITIQSQKYHNYDETLALELNIQREFKLNAVRVEFVYENIPFSAEYATDVFKLLKRDHPKMNGFLNGAECKFSDNILSIELKNGGLSVMREIGADKLIKDYINGHFQTNIKLDFQGITETTEQMLRDNVLSAVAYNPAPVPDTPPPLKNDVAWAGIPANRQKASGTASNSWAGHGKRPSPQ